MSKAGSMRGLSDSEPTRIRTSAISGSVFEDGIVLLAFLGRVARVRDQPLHLAQRRAIRRARCRDDVFFHHERAEVVRAEPQRHLPHLHPHRDPRRLNVGDVFEHDARDRLRLEIRHRVGLGEVRELGILGLQRPADERREAARPALHFADAKEVLDAVRVRLAQSVHHRHGSPETETMRDLHDLEPAIRAGLLARDLVAHALHQDLAAATRNGVEPRRHQLFDHFGDRHAEAPGEEVDLRRREAVNVDRMKALDIAQQIEIPLEGNVGVVHALHQNLDAPDRLQLVDLAPDFFKRQQIPFRVFGTTIECAELAVGDANVCVVDVAVDDVGDDVFRMEFPPDLVGETPELEQRGALVQLEVRAAASLSAASPMTSTASCGRPASSSRSWASARASANFGRICQTSRHNSSSNATDVRDEAESSTVRPSSCRTVRRLNSATLRTGPSQEMASSGRSTRSFAWRAYSIALMTLTSSSPATSRSFNSAGVPVTSSPPWGSATMPRSIAPYTGAQLM